MARFPDAVWKPFPENATQSRIRPTQVIHHVTASAGPISGTYKYFDLTSVKVESHFGVDFDGTAWQGIDTTIRADANYLANRRDDGTGAISVETAGTEFEHWTQAQIDWLVAHGVWCHEVHNIPLRICRSPGDPGFGYHTLFGSPSAWTPVAKSCPGPNRIRQWREVVFPRIKAKDVDMATAKEVWAHLLTNPATNKQTSAGTMLRYGYAHINETLARVGALEALVAQLLAEVHTPGDTLVTQEQITAWSKQGAVEALAAAGDQLATLDDEEG